LGGRAKAPRPPAHQADTDRGVGGCAPGLSVAHLFVFVVQPGEGLLQI